MLFKTFLEETALLNELYFVGMLKVCYMLHVYPDTDYALVCMTVHELVI